jgi:uroporphyrin-3 C-methyltransferase
MQAAIDALHGRLAAAESGLAGAQARALDARGDLDLAEVDYLLRLATERLQLFADPRSADRALALADAHLAALENPSYLGVRQAIASARGELAAVQLPDDLDIAGRLDAIQQAIPALPFRAASAAAPEAVPPAEQGWWEKLKSAVAGLVTVRRSTEEENQRITLQDKDYLRQRLWLQVEAAHMALMQRDQQAFQGALQRVQGSLSEWFDRGSREVAAVEQSLDALQAVDLAVSWPDISEPWNALRLVRAAQSPAAPAPAGQSESGASSPGPAGLEEDTGGGQ